ncbi:MAG: hypothetical protein KDK08_29215 [Rhizobiaceae bacterium]|nr:hypothetical protein [Rhizobiaceae bacterium]
MAKKLLFILLGIVAVVAAPFVIFILMYSVPIIGFSVQAYREELRARERMVERTYGAAFEGSEEVRLLSRGVTESGTDGRFSVTMILPDPGSGREERRFKIGLARLGEEACRTIVTSLASECRFLGEGNNNISGVVLLLEAAQKPPVDTSQPGWFAKPDIIRIKMRRSTSENWAEASRKLYEQVAAGCARSDTIQGGCVLGNIRMDINELRGAGGTVELADASVTMAVYRNFDVIELLHERRN